MAKAETKAKAPKVEAPSANGNLKVKDARRAVLKRLSKGRCDRNALKPVAPYGNYTKLMHDLEKEGYVKSSKQEGERLVNYDLTAKGKKAAGQAA